MRLWKRIFRLMLWPAFVMAEHEVRLRELQRGRIYPVVVSGGGVLSDTESREFVILRWPDGHETTAWDDENIRRR